MSLWQFKMDFVALEQHTSSFLEAVDSRIRRQYQSQVYLYDSSCPSKIVNLLQLLIYLRYQLHV